MAFAASGITGVAGALEPLTPYPCFAEFEQHTDFENNPGLLQQQRSACVGGIENDPGPKARNFATKIILSTGSNFMVEERTDSNWVITEDRNHHCRAENLTGRDVETLIGSVRYKVHENTTTPRRVQRRDGAKGPTLMHHPIDPRSSAVTVLGVQEYFGYRCQHYQLNDPGRTMGYRSESCELPMPPSTSCPASRVLESLTMHEVAPDGRVMVEKRTTFFKAGAIGTVFNASRIAPP